MDDEYIPIDKCIHRGVYHIDSRNLVHGIYNEKIKGFIGIRSKFNDEYLDGEYHYDIGAPSGTVKPLEFLHMLPDDIDIQMSHKKSYTRAEHLALKQEAYPTEPIEELEDELDGDYPQEFHCDNKPMFEHLENIWKKKTCLEE